jgi:hypothetical protein
MNNPFLPINETVSHDQAAEILTAGVSVYERGFTKHEALWLYWHGALQQQVSGQKRHKGLREDVHALLAQAGNPQRKSADFTVLLAAFRDTFPKPVLLRLSDLSVQINATQQCIKNWEAKAPSEERDRVIAANKAGLAEDFANHERLKAHAASIVGDFTVGRRCNWKSILSQWYDGPITLLSGNGSSAV